MARFSGDPGGDLGAGDRLAGRGLLTVDDGHVIDDRGEVLDQISPQSRHPGRRKHQHDQDRYQHEAIEVAHSVHHIGRANFNDKRVRHEGRAAS